ncbi:MAG: hypothetical protein WBQ44_04920 [Rhodococcus sp. (in: high G+C Gram-positive bacteria)]
MLDTDRYVQTITSLGSNPVMHGELADQITNEIMTRLDVENTTAEALSRSPRTRPACHLQ